MVKFILLLTLVSLKQVRLESSYSFLLFLYEKYEIVPFLDVMYIFSLAIPDIQYNI